MRLAEGWVMRNESSKQNRNMIKFETQLWAKGQWDLETEMLKGDIYDVMAGDKI